jgi:hypothetical protein
MQTDWRAKCMVIPADTNNSLTWVQFAICQFDTLRYEKWNLNAFCLPPPPPRVWCLVSDVKEKWSDIRRYITVDTGYHCRLNRSAMTLTARVITYVSLTLRRKHMEVSVATTGRHVVGIRYVASLKPGLCTAGTQQEVITLIRTHKTQPNVFSTLTRLLPWHCSQFRAVAMFIILHIVSRFCTQRVRMRLICPHVRLRSCRSSGSLVPEQLFDTCPGLCS